MILAVVVGIGINGGAIGSSAGSSGAAGRSGTGKTQSKARDRDTTALVRRLTDQNLRVEVLSTSSDDDCARLSYGQVRSYFAANRCAAMYRVLLQVTDRRQAVAVVAVASVDMADESRGRRLKTLVDTYGTGNISELTSSRRALRGVRWTGQHYVSMRDGTTMVNAQAEPVGRTAAAAKVAGIAATAVTTAP
ncbi:hypothetical protein [Pseudonocardia sediminis]|uniref:hypothetical protein n=1 Tax=Pseudonocardia sediminis TaxID=1397368 RepID=UPI00102A744C|nr:hypothetical protein [Pseudonocardia sediminis]